MTIILRWAPCWHPAESWTPQCRRPLKLITWSRPAVISTPARMSRFQLLFTKRLMYSIRILTRSTTAALLISFTWSNSSISTVSDTEKKTVTTTTPLEPIETHRMLLLLWYVRAKKITTTQRRIALPGKESSPISWSIKPCTLVGIVAITRSKRRREDRRSITARRLACSTCKLITCFTVKWAARRPVSRPWHDTFNESTAFTRTSVRQSNGPHLIHTINSTDTLRLSLFDRLWWRRPRRRYKFHDQTDQSPHGTGSQRSQLSISRQLRSREVFGIIFRYSTNSLWSQGSESCFVLLGCCFATFIDFFPSLFVHLQRKITTPFVWRTCSRIGTLKEGLWVWPGRVIWKTPVAYVKRTAIIAAVWRAWIQALWRYWITANTSHPPSLTSRWLTKSATISDRQYVAVSITLAFDWRKLCLNTKCFILF